MSTTPSSVKLELPADHGCGKGSRRERWAHVRTKVELDAGPTVSFNLGHFPESTRREKVHPVSIYNVEPDARVLWCLRRRKSDVRCVLYPNAMPVEVRVVQDRDVVLTERFQEEWVALNWARAYSDRLRQQGWFDSPGD